LALVAVSGHALWTQAASKPSPRKALELESASGYRWCDLGEEYLASGRTSQAKYCMARATQLAPNIPPVWVRAANLHFQLGEPETALRYSVHVLSLVPDYDGVIFGYYDLLFPDTPAILAALGPNPRALQSYLRHLIATNQVAAAQLAWARCTGPAATDPVAAEYLSFLIRSGKRHEAAAWHAHAGRRSPDYGTSNQLFNAGFELEPTKAEFDWTISPLEGVEAARDSSQAHTGRWSLRIQFAGQSNVDYRHVSQSAWLAPGAYRLRAYMKTDSITTNEGIRIRIADRDAPQRLDISTDPLTGTHDWTLVQKTFTVSAPTNLILIQICRNASMKFDNKISGTIWLDSFSLSPAS
jgi:hypothetical protein